MGDTPRSAACNPSDSGGLCISVNTSGTSRLPAGLSLGFYRSNTPPGSVSSLTRRSRSGWYSSELYQASAISMPGKRRTAAQFPSHSPSNTFGVAAELLDHHDCGTASTKGGATCRANLQPCIVASHPVSDRRSASASATGRRALHGQLPLASPEVV